MAGSSARTVWALRMQRKVATDYEKRQRSPARRMAIVAAVAAIHVVLVLSFLSWRGEGHRLPLLIKVKLIPATWMSPKK